MGGAIDCIDFVTGYEVYTIYGGALLSVSIDIMDYVTGIWNARFARIHHKPLGRGCYP